MTIFHQISVFIRHRGHGIHSYSSGHSWLARILRIPESVIQQHIEPVIGFFVGYGLCQFDRALGFWMIAASGALFVDQQLERFILWRRLQDTLDSRSNAKTLSAQVQEQATPPAASRPRTSWRVKRPKPVEQGNPIDFRKGLDNDVRAFLEESTDHDE
jgi:hypothetical protein